MNIDIQYVMNYSQEELLKNNSSIINKLKTKLEEDINRQFFNSHFCLYLNYDKNEDFLIKLDHVWKWLGCVRIEQCKTLLFNNFIENTDYINEHYEITNKNVILLTIKCFKKLCLLARTTKSLEFHNYYLRIEELLFNLITDETQEFSKALTLKKKEIDTSTLLDKKLFYIMIIKEKKDVIKEIAFGASNNIEELINEYRFIGYFHSVFESPRNFKIESIVKEKFRTNITNDNRIIFDSSFEIKDFYKEVLRIRDYVISQKTLLKEIEELESKLHS